MKKKNFYKNITMGWFSYRSANVIGVDEYVNKMRINMLFFLLLQKKSTLAVVVQLIHPLNWIECNVDFVQLDSVNLAY